MTFVQSQSLSSSLLQFRLLFAALLAIAVAGVVSLVFLYNSLVDIRHDASASQNLALRLEGENAELEQRIIALVDSRALAAFAATRGLVKETSPRYLEGTAQWAFASRY